MRLGSECCLLTPAKSSRKPQAESCQGVPTKAPSSLQAGVGRQAHSTPVLRPNAPADGNSPFVPQKRSSSLKKKFKNHHRKPKSFSSFKQSG